MRFLDVKTDYAFKKIFGSVDSKERLISFLNSIIYLNQTKQISDLTIVDPCNIPMLKGMKDSFVDVKAVLDDGSKVIIEMQVLNHTGFEKRVLYNTAKNYCEQLSKKEDYRLLNPVIALNIVDFVIFDSTDKVITNFKLLEKQELIDYGDDIQLIFVELPKFLKDITELNDIKDQWLYFLKNAGSLDAVPKDIDKILKNALQTANMANMSVEELEFQRKRKEFIYIQKNSITLATDTGYISGMEKGMKDGMTKGMEKGMKDGMTKGMKDGMTKGKKEGIEQTMEKVAKTAISQGMDDQTISAITQLSIGDIEKLRQI